jgi:hypothetical protein
VARGAEIPHDEDISVSPRMIAFVDVPPETMFLPLAAELNDGRVVTFFTLPIEKLQQDGGTLPAAYPRSTLTEGGRQERDAHWKWCADQWNVDKVVTVMEEVIGDRGRPRWVDYRMGFSTGRCCISTLLRTVTTTRGCPPTT